MFIYGVTTVGATVHLHFCMDKFIGWDLSKSENKSCVKCGMKESATKKGCCKDEVKQLKIDTEHQKSSAAIFMNVCHPLVTNAPASLSEFTKAVFDENSIKINYAPSPIPSVKKLTVLYCTYRI